MAPRTYSSPLREAQAQRTREQLLETTYRLLAADGIEALTLPALAKAAGVSAPTVYRHFANVEVLLSEFLAWLRPQLGQALFQLVDASPATLPASNFPRYEAHSAVLTAVMDSPTWNRIRVASMTDRAGQVAVAYGDTALDQRELRLRLGAVYSLATPIAWRWLRETWELDEDAAREAAQWAMQVLLEAVEKE